MHLSEADRAYLAGIIDGEGSIYLDRRLYDAKLVGTIRVSVYSTTLELLEWVMARCGGSIGGSNQKGHLGKLPCFSWRVSGTRAVLIVRAVRPWLIVKAAKADAVLAAYEETSARMKRPGRRDFHFAQVAGALRELGWTEDLLEPLWRPAYA